MFSQCACIIAAARNYENHARGWRELQSELEIFKLLFSQCKYKTLPGVNNMGSLPIASGYARDASIRYRVS